VGGLDGGDEISELVRQVLARVKKGTVLGEEAVELGRRLWEAVGAGSRDVPVEAVLALAGLHWWRYLEMPVLDDSKDLDTALVFFGRIAEIDETAPPAPVRELLDEGAHRRQDPVRWLTRATEVVQQAEHQQDGARADKAVHMFRLARAWFPADSPIRPHLQGQLAIALNLRFQHTRRPADLDAALDHARLAVSESDEREPRLQTYLTNLCSWLLDNYRLSGQNGLLHEAVEVGRRAVLIADSTIALTNLAAALRERHRALGRRADIDEVVAMTRKALQNNDEPRNDTVRANLVDVLVLRADGDDLDEAIAIGDRLLESIPPGHPLRPQVASNVALALRARSDGSGDRALGLEREALAAVARTHPGWSRVAANTAHSLIKRAGERRSDEDLAEGLALVESALRASSAGDPSLAWRLQVIATGLELRAERHNRQADKEKALIAWQRSSKVTVSPVHVRLQSAVRGGQWAQSALGDQAAALDSYSTAVALLDRLAWRGLERPDQEAWLSTWAGLVRLAVAVAVGENDLDAAVRLAEQGRAVLWSQSTSARSDLVALREAAPALAERLSEIAKAFG
jgi:hypothetical protein